MSFITKQYTDQRTTLITQPETAADIELLGFGVPAAKSILFDATVSEDHERRNLITENPIEDGSVISDHITTLPFALSISGIFTDTPLSKTIPFFEALNSEEGRARQLWDDLVKVDESNVFFTIITGVKAYKNLLFEELIASRNSPESAIRFRARVKQVLITTQNGTLPTNVSEDVFHTTQGLQAEGIVIPLAL